MSNCHSWPLDTMTGGRSASWSANMSSNSRNVKSPFLTNRCYYQGGRSASWSANMSSNSRNVKLPFLTTRCHYWGERVDMPVDLPIWGLTVEIWNHHSWPLDATTGGGGRSASWSANMTSKNRNVNLPYWPLDDTTVGDRSASWSAHMSSNSRNGKSSFLTTRCHYCGW